MLLELGKQNPQVLRLINENQAEFFRLINEAGAGEGGEGYVPWFCLFGIVPAWFCSLISVWFCSSLF
jgi:hypothetical protein